MNQIPNSLKLSDSTAAQGTATAYGVTPKTSDVLMGISSTLESSHCNTKSSPLKYLDVFLP